jgi:dTDP-4-dehydrorhamnose reductase
MRALIFGGSGGVGSKISELMIKNNIDTFYTYFSNPLTIEGAKAYKCDITDRETVLNLFKKIKPDLVIHTIAIPSVDECEVNKNLALRINVEGTRNIVDGCKGVNGKIVLISTSHIFDGKKKIYNEKDEPNPINYYGITKLEGENIVLNSGLNFLIIRTDQLYGWIKKGQKGNTVVRILSNLNSGKVTEEIIDWYNSPTLTDNCTDVIFSLLERNKNGVYHVVGSDFINRYEWGLKITEIFNKDKNLIRPINSSKLNLPAKRPNARLDNKKAEKDSGIKLMNVEDGLIYMKRMMK